MALRVQRQAPNPRGTCRGGPFQARPLRRRLQLRSKKGQSEKGSIAAVATAVDEAKWKSPNLSDVVDYDPFALPPAFPKPPVIDIAGANGADLVAAADVEDAKKMADALAESNMQLEELKQRGVQVIVRERNQYVAMIGDRTVHVGDEIDGFTITKIDPQGVHVERTGAQ
jgi:hypothetical protein